MPRGGGFGGGFRGGGFGGGGFRGGGFRGGGFGGRGWSGGGYRPSGVPFGRTGARRTVSGTSRGPYSHRYYGPRRRYYRYWYYPWYRRWWYTPYWCGFWYRPWYYSPAYVGGGIAFAIIISLVILPAVGVAIWYPFSNADLQGNVTYSSTEVLNYNEYWYEHEYIKAGQQISFTVESKPSLVSFAIWSKPFTSLPTTIKSGNYSETNLNINAGYYEYYQIYLKPGSTINYNFTAGPNGIDFFIFDGNNAYRWDQGLSYTSYVTVNDATNIVGSPLYISVAKDYYLVWYNDGSPSFTQQVNFSIAFSAAGVYDLTKASYSEEAKDFFTGNYTVPSEGDWYFFIYFDPLYSPEESTDITFDVTYHTGITANERWVSIAPILIVILVIIAIIIIAAVVARSSQKKLKPSSETSKIKEKGEITPSTSKKVITKTVESKQKCSRCGSENTSSAHYCVICGGKLSGRQIKTTEVVTPANSKKCALCGSKISLNDKFCKFCGTEIEQNP